MTSEIDKLKHFHVENYSGTNFTILIYLFFLVIIVFNGKNVLV